MIEYCDEVPSDVLMKICDMFDKDEVWKELAERMKYGITKIDEIDTKAKNRGHSPSKALFDDWARYHHYLIELNVLLYRMEHIPAMQCLSPYVDTRYHTLLHDLLVRIATPGYDVKFKEDGSLKNKQRNVHNLIANESSIPHINYRELSEATDNWNKLNIIGAGGFGEVFKAKWKNSLVAVKKLKFKDFEKTIKELIREIGLDNYRHDNLLPLYGYSVENGGQHVCLLHQLMAGGSLDKRIHNQKHDPNFVPLTWPQRYEIALGVSRGLQYLHDKENLKSLIHADIKPANILLDEYLRPKIGDFGLSKNVFFGDNSHLIISGASGTAPYMPPEYLWEHELTRSLDTYSFGVVVLEMATCRPSIRTIKIGDKKKLLRLALEISNEIKGPDFDKASLEDSALRYTTKSNPELFLEVLAIGLLCTSLKRKSRPSMTDVYKRLDGIPKNVIYK